MERRSLELQRIKLMTLVVSYLTNSKILYALQGLMILSGLKVLKMKSITLIDMVNQNGVKRNKPR